MMCFRNHSLFISYVEYTSFIMALKIEKETGLEWRTAVYVFYRCCPLPLGLFRSRNRQHCCEEAGVLMSCNRVARADRLDDART